MRICFRRVDFGLRKKKRGEKKGGEGKGEEKKDWSTVGHEEYVALERVEEGKGRNE